jgi:drug/metabolite transporter (DMT)-like permease
LHGYLLLAAGMGTVGSYVALSKPLTEVMPVGLLATLRFAIAAVAMLPWLKRGAGDAPLERRIVGELTLQSFFGNFLFSLLMLSGVALTSAAAAGLVLASLPAVVALLSWLLLRERLSGRGWLAVALTVAGVALLGLARSPAPDVGGALSGGSTGGVGDGLHGGVGGGLVSGQTTLGVLLVFGCVICEAIYVIVGKRLTAHLSARRISALINLIGLVLMLPLGLAQARGFDFTALGAGHWALLVFYSLAASMWSTWLWLTGLARVPASQSGVFTIALPVTATSIGVLFLGETPQWVHAVAFICAAAGIVLIAREREPARVEGIGSERSG